MALLRDPTRDIVRGLNSLETIFINISDLSLTDHAPYIAGGTGITYADTIFPCFAFLSGMSPVPARRSVGLIGIGLSIHSLNSFINSKPLRVPGVLQRLGLASFIANEPKLGFLREFNALPLVIMWYAISLLGSSSKTSNPLASPKFPGASVPDTAQSRIDLALFGTSHLHTPNFDPEGVLGTLMTATSMIIGNMFATQRLSASENVSHAVGMIALGEALHFLLPKYAPVSKSLWTPSFILVSSGISMLKYIAIEALVPYLPGAVKLTLEAVGRRSLEVYVISQVLTMGLRYGQEKSLWSRGCGWLGQFIGQAGGDFILSIGLTGAMAISASILVKNGLKLKW